MFVQLRMLVDIGLGSLYFGCFLYVAMRYTFTPNGDFHCDSCTAVFGISSGLCALFVVDCLAVGWMFLVLGLFQAVVLVFARVRLMLVDRVFCRVCACGAHRLFAFGKVIEGLRA